MGIRFGIAAVIKNNSLAALRNHLHRKSMSSSVVLCFITFQTSYFPQLIDNISSYAKPYDREGVWRVEKVKNRRSFSCELSAWKELVLLHF